MTTAGALKDRLRFEQRAVDANGDLLGPWDTAGGFTRAAGVATLTRGAGEEVLQQRMTGKQPVIITVYDEAASRAVTSAWRAVDTRTGAVYDIRTNAYSNTDRRLREMLAVQVVGEGSDGGGV